VSETGYTAPTPNTDLEIGDRVTRLFLDVYGHALRVEDGVGADRYASYNERGEVAKEWQSVLNNDGATDALTVPSPRAQEEVIRLACRNAGTDISNFCRR